jgi:hypothetical protein
LKRQWPELEGKQRGVHDRVDAAATRGRGSQSAARRAAASPRQLVIYKKNEAASQTAAYAKRVLEPAARERPGEAFER